MNDVMTENADTHDDYSNNFSVSKRRELIFSEFKRRNKLRVIFKDCPVGDMSEMLERFEAIHKERLEEERLKNKEEYNLQIEAEKILKNMEEQGIDLGFLKDIKEKMSRSEIAKVKYVKGGVTWSGQGRRPAPFKGLSDIELERFRP
jgi:DNA-binding protein H-NS